jgi:hypothetical protein
MNWSGDYKEKLYEIEIFLTVKFSNWSNLKSALNYLFEFQLLVTHILILIAYDYHENLYQ